MDYAKARFYLMVLLLVSSAFFPSTQEAFAVTNPVTSGTQQVTLPSETFSNLTIDNGGTLIVPDQATLIITGQLTINGGGKLIVEDGGTIEIDGTTSANGILVNPGGSIEQHGSIIYKNLSAAIYVNFGNWTVFCGATLDTGNAPFTGTPGTPTIEECNGTVTEVPLVIPNGIIFKDDTYTIQLNENEISVLEDDLTIFGTLENSYLLSNRALITIEAGGLISQTSSGSIDNICGNYPTRGITGNGQINGDFTTIVCNPPIPDNDSYSTPENTLLEIPVSGVLSNDLPGENDDIPGNDPTLQSSLLNGPTNGDVLLKTDGSFDYTPDTNFNGDDSFTYTVSDGNGGEANASVTITVTSVNESPVADDDSAITAEDTLVTIDVLDGDTDGDGDILTIADAQNPSDKGGTVVIVADKIDYIPDTNFNGDDSFTYTVSDGNGGTDIGTVTITVTPVDDDLPIANDDSATTAENKLVTIDVLGNDTDPDDDTFTITSVTQGTSGTVVITNAGADLTYEPNEHFSGTDTFSYTITDNDGSDTADVTVSVSDTNDPPVVTIVSPLDNAVFIIGEPVDFVGTSTDEEDGILSSTLNWFDYSLPIGTGESFTLSNLPEGVHEISAASHDTQGVETVEAIIITVQIDLENELFCDDMTIAQLEEKANKGKYNLIDNRGNPSSILIGTADKDLILAGNFGDTIKAKGGDDCVIGGSGFDTINGGDGNDEIFGLGGTDEIKGGLGNDLLDGGNGGDFITGGDGNDKINGGDKDDEINGGAGNDEINGGDGNDSIIGKDGNDKIDGGSGFDTITGGAGKDHIKGGDGDDEITGGAGNDKIDGGIGEDILKGGTGNDHIKGGIDDDELIGGKGNDKLEGNEDNDTITGGAGKDHIKGGDGDDTITGGAGKDHIKGDDGNDKITGGNDDDKIEGGSGMDSIKGNAGNDHIKGGDGDDDLKGNAGNDHIDGDKGNDVILGGDGNDKLHGKDGNDHIKGGLGDDEIKGDKDDDILRGNDGNDELKGGDGDDDLKGQAGNDTLKGEKGIDSLNGGADEDRCYDDKDDTLKNCEIIKSHGGDDDGDDKHDHKKDKKKDD